MQVLGALENKLKINLKTPEGYQFKPTREHYSIVKNSLAIQCNKQNVKLDIKADDGTSWFYVDNSYNLNEAETVHPESALLDNLGIQKYFNEHKETGFKMTPLFLMEMINKMNQNNLLLQKNLQDMIKLTNIRIERLENDRT